jgi:ubiquinone/menaquinone biosynthesis C-methylase UbiE
LQEETIMAAQHFPVYHDLQSAFHKAFRDELVSALDLLPITPTSRVLDAPCGDGFHARHLAARLGPGGRLTLADASDLYLAAARRTLSLADGPAIELTRADIYSLPFADGQFDAVWCAQSLITLNDSAAALGELARVTRPGGTLAVLESDEFHQLLLPWPVDLELCVHRALLEASRQKYGDRGRLAPARRVRRYLLGAGLRTPRKKSFTADRHAPFDPLTAQFLRLKLESLAKLVRPYLRQTERERFDRFIDPACPASIHHRPDGELTCLGTVHLARKPAYRRKRQQADPHAAAGR